METSSGALSVITKAQDPVSQVDRVPTTLALQTARTLAPCNLTPNWSDLHPKKTLAFCSGSAIAGLAVVIAVLGWANVHPHPHAGPSALTILAFLVGTIMGVGGIALATCQLDGGLGRRRTLLTLARSNWRWHQPLLDNGIATEDEIIQITQAYLQYQNTSQEFPKDVDDVIIQKAVASLEAQYAPVINKIRGWEEYLDEYLEAANAKHKKQIFATHQEALHEKAAHILAQAEVHDALLSGE